MTGPTTSGSAPEGAPSPAGTAASAEGASAPAGAVARAAAPHVELRGITKRFGHLVANAGVDLDLLPGEIHGLLGENGAGKTTLMRILYGLTSLDEGEIRVGGRPLHVGSPKDAIAAGIGMVTQHFSLVGPMSVAENIVLGRTAGPVLDLAAATRAVAAASERFGIRVRPEARTDTLSVGEQQRVEIVKALYRECRVLILDEPTAVLVPQEVAALFETLRRLRAEGMAVVFISHKLDEVMAITDRVTVLRHGRVAGEVRTSTTNARELAALMVGRPTFGVERSGGMRAGEPVLEVRGLSATGAHGLPALREVELAVRAGEVVGLAGVSGNGQTELAEVLSGMRRPTGGSVRVGGRELAGAGPRELMAAGVGRIAEDRHASVVPQLSVAHNLVLEHLDEYRRGGRLDERRIRADAEALIARFAIKARPGDPVASLSGGNLQKVILARVLAREPRLIVVAQPTRGLDVGATEYVRSVLLEQRARGAAVLLISEDLDELLALSDRLLVIYEGRIVGEVAAGEADPERLGLLMAGSRAA
ncbi:MAG TPA: ABC transporter ATP-binding protein [Candidatus Limnocylindrales bacterium]|nr:ABC transporter ATP-binding protein [Candidatus Limnocylindrales bacterium]